MKIGKINSSQDGIVFDMYGIVNCLSAGHGNVPKVLINEKMDNAIRERCGANNPRGGRTTMTKKHNWDVVVQQEENLLIPSNTKKGFEEVLPGDSINFSVPNSKTRRGRVGKGKAQTLDTQCNQGVMVQKEFTKGNSQSYRVYEIEGISQTINSGGGGVGGKTGLYDVSNLKDEIFNIRRLTEIECERLQGLPDNWTKFGNYDGVAKGISSTQRYKLCGNGVTVDVVELIGEKLRR